MRAVSLSSPFSLTLQEYQAGWPSPGIDVVFLQLSKSGEKHEFKLKLSKVYLGKTCHILQRGLNWIGSIIKPNKMPKQYSTGDL